MSTFSGSAGHPQGIATADDMANGGSRIFTGSGGSQRTSSQLPCMLVTPRQSKATGSALPAPRNRRTSESVSENQPAGHRSCGLATKLSGSATASSRRHSPFPLSEPIQSTSITLDGELACSSARPPTISAGLKIGEGVPAAHVVICLGFRFRKRERSFHQLQITITALAASSCVARSVPGTALDRQAHCRHHRCRRRAITSTGAVSTPGMHFRSREREKRRQQL